MPFFLEVKKKSPNHSHHHQQDGGARDKRKSFQMHSIGRNSIGHPTISVSSVTPPTDGSEYRISARAGLGPDEILVSSKKSSLTPGMATAGLVIAARNDFQVSNFYLSFFLSLKGYFLGSMPVFIKQGELNQYIFTWFLSTYILWLRIFGNMSSWFQHY
jgi:hypothetical protein